MSDVTTAEKFNQKYKEIQSEISTVIVGQNEAVNGVLMALFCNSHALLVGVPGLAKTLLIKTISEVLDLKFNRIQFTPDLMPGDITGNEILDENRSFKFIKRHKKELRLLLSSFYNAVIVILIGCQFSLYQIQLLVRH